MARLEGASNHKPEFINNIYIKFHEINPLSARSYIPTAKRGNKKAIINPKNNDNKCFFIFNWDICFL